MRRSIALILSVALLAAPAAAAAETAVTAETPPKTPIEVPAKEPPTPKLQRYTLKQLIQLAYRGYPGIQAAKHALDGAKADQFRAKWSWLPTFNLSGFFAPVPRIRCKDRDGNFDPTGEDCTSTDFRLDASNFNIAGVYVKIDLQTTIPLYTFGKLTAARRAADAGVAAKRGGIKQSKAKIAKQVTEAYWGLKMAREILYTIKTARKHLDKAIERMEAEIDEGEGENTLADLLRLKTSAAQVDSKTLEAEKLEKLAAFGLAALTGLAPGTFDVDPAIIELVDRRLASAADYLAAAARHRPEVSMLRAARQAAQAQQDLEKANFFPNIGLVGSTGIAYASSIDTPQHAFYQNPFNAVSAGLGLGLSWGISPLQQVGKYRKAKAMLREVRAKQQEALIGITMEIRKAYANQEEVLKKFIVTQRGQKLAKRWLVSVSQSLAAGLSEPKDLTDALVNYFVLKLDYLKALYSVNVGWAELGRVVGKDLAQTEPVKK